MAVAAPARTPTDGDEDETPRPSPTTRTRPPTTPPRPTTDEAEGGSSTRRRRRRRRRSGGGGGEASADDADDDDRPERAGRNGRTTSDDDVRGVAGSTRLEAKRQRRRDGRDTGRRRAPILTESEFLARREAVDRKMVIRQRGERTQIAVLEDDVLVEHYVTQAQATSFAGNVYLGRVQNVLPSMEAAFVDIGKGRNAVLYAGEVNWDAAGLSGKQRSIETALKSGDKVLVQVTKDPIGHKGARLTQQINLPGRFLVYVPGGSMTGISRKLPDTERTRLKDILKKIVPEDAGVIIRTAAEGASEEELTRDVNRLTAQWDVIQKKAESTSNAPTLLYGEPDLAIRVIRDVFNEDFKELVVQGDDAWDTVEAYVAHVSPELAGRLSRYTGEGDVVPRPAHRRAADEGARPQGLAALGRLAGHRPHRGDDRRRRQHRQVRRLRAATSSRPSRATTWRRRRRSSASSGCATSAASSSSTSSTWCSRATATSCCGGSPSASAATAPSTRSPRSPRWAWCR